MKKRLFAGLLATVFLAAAFTIPAEASCSANNSCIGARMISKAATKAKSSGKHVAKKTGHTKKAAHSKKTVHNKHRTKKKAAAPKSIKRVAKSSHGAHPPVAAGGGHVVSLIQSMAPSYGVPTWFALRIAKVESNYNPHLRGRAGEYGVFQMKCATAKGIGFSGNCSALLDPAVNVRWGLKHLSIAMAKSGGNLRLAASKHNGGLGRKTEIRGYVAKVF